MHDEDVFIGSTENRSDFRQQKKFECQNQMPVDRGVKYV